VCRRRSVITGLLLVRHHLRHRARCRAIIPCRRSQHQWSNQNPAYPSDSPLNGLVVLALLSISLRVTTTTTRRRYHLNNLHPAGAQSKGQCTPFFLRNRTPRHGEHLSSTQLQTCRAHFRARTSTAASMYMARLFSSQRSIFPSIPRLGSRYASHRIV